MTISALPTAPSTSSPSTFPALADAFVAALATFRTEANALALGMQLAANGGAFAIPFTFSTTTTDSDPGAGYMRLNQATQNTATVIRLDDADNAGRAMAALIALMDDSTSAIKGFIRLQDADDATKFIIFSLASLSVQSGYTNLTVTVVHSSAASPFANAANITLDFLRNGDKGDTGAAGAAGVSNMPGFITPNGLQHSTAGSSASYDLSSGAAMDSTNSYLLNLTGALAKTTSSWGAGSAGALDVGTIEASKMYYSWLIGTAAGATVDNLVSLANGRNATATMTIATPAVVTLALHGLQVNAPIKFSTTGALPTGVVAGTQYYVKTVVDENTFQISATQGGSAINTTGSQSGVHTLVSEPVMPATYTLKRLIWAMKTSGGSQWLRFYQNGNHCELDAQVQEAAYTGGAPGVSTPFRLTLTSVPKGMECEVDIGGYYRSSVGTNNCVVGSGNKSSEDNTTSGAVTAISQVNNGISSYFEKLYTDRAGRLWIVTSDSAPTGFYINCRGWTFPRAQT